MGIEGRVVHNEHAGGLTIVVRLGNFASKIVVRKVRI